MIADKLLQLFSYKLDVDDREPFLEVDLGGNTLGFFFPSILYWAQALMLIPICSFFAMAMATVTYFLIIPRQRSIIAYLIGFGIVIPITTCYFPFMVMDFFDIRNRILRFCVGAVFPVLSMFRTSEAMFGFSPHSVEKSWKNYVLYHSAGVGIQFDKNTGRPIRATNKEVLGAIQNFLQLVFILGFYQSIFGPSNYEPYETSINANEQGYNLMDVFDLNLLRNNFISTMLLQLYLYTYLTALTILVTGIMGIKVQEGMMDNPLIKATSPSNFWGGRWNVLVHDSLKRGVFKPVYSVSTKFIAVVATFLASGLFHEYLLLLLHPPHLGFEPSYGKNTAFMLWNAGVIALETMVGKAKIFGWIKNTFPRYFVTFLVLCTAMPIAHWFLHPYVKSGMFQDGHIAKPMIKIIY